MIGGDEGVGVAGFRGLRGRRAAGGTFVGGEGEEGCFRKEARARMIPTAVREPVCAT